MPKTRSSRITDPSGEQRAQEIKILCACLREELQKQPYLRLGQLLVNLISSSYRDDIGRMLFYVEDDDLFNRMAGDGPFREAANKAGLFTGE